MTKSSVEKTIARLEHRLGVKLFHRTTRITRLTSAGLATQERVVCAPPHYLRTMGEPTSLSDIHQHRCIVGSPKGPPLNWFVRDEEIDKQTTPPATHQLSDAEAMVQACVSGLGLAQFPVSLVRNQFSDGRLRSILHMHAGAFFERYLI